MNTIESYAKNPDQLLDLVREMISCLAAEENKSEIVATEAQLREVARAVENLEKLNVPVPEALRGEKTRLAALLTTQSASVIALNRFVEGLEGIIKERNPGVARNPKATPKREGGAKRSRLPRTSDKVLRELIIEALKHFGGSARKKDIEAYMEEKLKGKLLQGDLIWRGATKGYAWQNNTDWEHSEMIQEGILKKGSPRGIWELSGDFDENM